MDQALCDEFEKILNNKKSTEQNCQDFLENNPDFLIPDHSLNHGLHGNFYLSKLPLDTSLITDLVFLTKSSTKWNIVLVELENPQCPLFTNNTYQVNPSAELTKGISQINSWKEYLNKNSSHFVKKLDPIRVPLTENSYEFKYVLIIGREDVLSRNQAMRDRINTLEGNDIIIHTYDSLLRHYVNNNSPLSSNILKLTKNKFTFKYLHSQPESLFAYTSNEHFILQKDHRNQLLQWGYDIDEWDKGKLLADNGKKVQIL